MRESERLTRKKKTNSLTGRGNVSTEYTSDETKQALTIRLAAYEDTALSPEEIETARENGGVSPMPAEDGDVLEAWRTGRMICPQCCGTCGRYPDPLQPAAFCEATGRATRRVQYCAEWIIGRNGHEL